MISASQQVSGEPVQSVASPSPDRPGAVASPYAAIQKIVQRRVSGRLSVRELDNDAVFWQLHAGDGHFHYAGSSVGQHCRLAYVLQRIQSPLVNRLPSLLPQNDYGFLCQLWQTGEITLAQVRQLIYLMSQEALVHILARPQAMLLFDRAVGLDPILLSVPPKAAVSPLSKQVARWRQLRPQVDSPLQRIRILDAYRLRQRMASLQALQGPRSQMDPLQALAGQPCIYEVAYRLDADLLQVASTLAVLARSEAVAMRPFISDNQTNRPTVACIDDSAAVQRQVQLTLEAAGYRVLSFTDPLRALSSLVREKPALVLMDITMPDLDGYELCRMLKQSSALRQTPIVMLTGREGLVDRVRAKLVGAVDYVTKPFDIKTLTAVVDKLVQIEQCAR